MGCWLDTQSVKNVLTAPDINAYLTNGATQTLANSTLQDVQNNYISILTGSGYLSNDQFDSNITNIKNLKDPTAQINAIVAILDKVFFNQKAELLLLRGNAYAQLATLTSPRNLNANNGPSGRKLKQHHLEQ